MKINVSMRLMVFLGNRRRGYILARKKTEVTLSPTLVSHIFCNGDFPVVYINGRLCEVLMRYKKIWYNPKTNTLHVRTFFDKRKSAKSSRDQIHPMIVLGWKFSRRVAKMIPFDLPV